MGRTVATTAAGNEVLRLDAPESRDGELCVCVCVCVKRFEPLSLTLYGAFVCVCIRCVRVYTHARVLHKPVNHYVLSLSLSLSLARAHTHTHTHPHAAAGGKAPAAMHDAEPQGAQQQMGLHKMPTSAEWSQVCVLCILCILYMVYILYTLGLHKMPTF